MITGNLTSDYLIFFNNLKILEMAEFLTMEEAENKFGKKGENKRSLNSWYHWYCTWCTC